MPVQTGQYVSQADMDALAALANQNLLPIVNAQIQLGKWPSGYNSISGNLNDGNYNTISNRYDYYNSNGTLQNPQPPYKFDSTKTNWLDELNRIRGDWCVLYFNQRFTNYYLNTTPQSGQWVIGVNDVNTFSQGSSLLSPNGELLGSLSKSYGGIGTFLLTLYKNVKFYFSKSDAPSGVSINSGRKCNFGFGNSPFNYTASRAGTWKASITRFINSYTGNPPTVSQFNIVNHSSVPIVWSVLFDSSSNRYYLSGSINSNISAGTGTISFTYTVPSGVGLNAAFAFNSKLIFSTNSSVVNANAIHPLPNGCAYVAASDIPANSDFILNGNYSSAWWSISDPNLMGCWVANTLPIPGMNVYVDQDMPPYIGVIETEAFGQYLVGAAGNRLFSYTDSDAPIASSVKQSALIEIGNNQQVTSVNPKWGIVQPSISNRPTRYLTIRDTDFVPFNYGFNSGYFQTFDLFIPANGTSDPNNISFFVYDDTTSLRIRIVPYGTANLGWKNGQFQYGDLMPAIFPINFNGAFTTNNNQVDIPNDGGVGYLNTVIGTNVNLSVTNNTASDFFATVIVELNPASTRQYFPSSGTTECFSYLVDGTQFFAGATTNVKSKPIPQNGYCIFKVRATRLPQVSAGGISVTPSSGNQISVTLGQNKLQNNGSIAFVPFVQNNGVTPFTITIPANARDTGDVEVFWPILGGNELVWQCAETVIVESWVNWQPIFFEGYYGTYQPNGFTPSNFNSPTVFEYCGVFLNRFNIRRANYPPTQIDHISGFDFPRWYGTKVQFPLCKEMYNDLETVLNQIS